MILNLLNILSIVAAVAAEHVAVHGKRPAAPSGFSSQGLAPPTGMIILRVALTSNSVTGLEDKLPPLRATSSDSSCQWTRSAIPISYNEHKWQISKVKTFVQPSPETVSAFNAFATSHDLETTVISPNVDWVLVTLPIYQANMLFNTQSRKVHTPDLAASENAYALGINTLQAGWPHGCDPSHHMISGFPAALGCLCVQALQVFTGCLRHICLQELYGIPATAATEKGNALLVTGFVGEFTQTVDLNEFLRQFRPDILSNETFTLLTTDNGTSPQGPERAGDEANLDVQYAAGIATEVPIQLLLVGGEDNVSGFATALLDTTAFLDGLAQPPSVMTTSYGFSEAAFGSSMATSVFTFIHTAHVYKFYIAEKCATTTRHHKK
ncbi:hypothetical protein DFH09DRAFT_1078947 [Mycena vulgaris]|nr:hypothetical protein DFH09DRAFT_1078947 [Mycena vulgaris]